jgi:hypothetical protein
VGATGAAGAAAGSAGAVVGACALAAFARVKHPTNSATAHGQNRKPEARYAVIVSPLSKEVQMERTKHAFVS